MADLLTINVAGGDTFGTFVSITNNAIDRLNSISPNANTILVGTGYINILNVDTLGSNTSTLLLSPDNITISSNTLNTAANTNFFGNHVNVTANLELEGLTTSTQFLVGAINEIDSIAANPAAQLGTKEITTTMLVDAAVTSTKIAAKGIQANNIADGIITSTQISSLGVQANSIATGAITIAKIPSSANVAFQHRLNTFDLNQTFTLNIKASANVDITGTLNALAPSAANSEIHIGTNSTGNRTISTSTPSGGANGDIWYQREA